MKTKKLSKKLGLNKITIAQLNDRDLRNIKGGDNDDDFQSLIYITCDPFTCATLEYPCGGSGGTGYTQIIQP